VAHYGYALDGMPVTEHDSLSVQEQIEIIKNWKFTPDIIINIRVSLEVLCDLSNS